MYAFFVVIFQFIHLGLAPKLINAFFFIFYCTIREMEVRFFLQFLSKNNTVKINETFS